MISFDDFAKLELKVGTVLEVEDVEGADKLLKLKVDLGEESPRQILAGIKKFYKKESLVGKQVIVVANLEPKVFKGVESQGMVLAVDASTSLSTSSKPILLKPSSKVPSGAKIL